MKPTKADFDEAVKQPWGPCSCLLWQMAKRLGELDDRGEIPSSYTERRRKLTICEGVPIHYRAPYNDLEAIKVMLDFDQLFDSPGDERKPELQAMRASLPD